jgi:hypothetical protein
VAFTINSLTEKLGFGRPFFTGGLVMFTYLLWYVSDQTNQISIQTQRAFITFSNASPVEKSIDDKTKLLTDYVFHIAVINNGTTPTKRAVYQMNEGATDQRPDASVNFDTLPQSEKIPTVFGPKALIDVRIIIPLSDLEAVQAGRKHVFVWGWSVYRDIFSNTPIRLSEYCEEVTNPKWTGTDHSAPKTDLNINYAPCPTYNCYDDNCEDYSTRISELR